MKRNTPILHKREKFGLAINFDYFILLLIALLLQRL